MKSYDKVLNDFKLKSSNISNYLKKSKNNSKIHNSSILSKNCVKNSVIMNNNKIKGKYINKTVVKNKNFEKIINLKSLKSSSTENKSNNNSSEKNEKNLKYLNVRRSVLLNKRNSIFRNRNSLITSKMSEKKYDNKMTGFQLEKILKENEKKSELGKIKKKIKYVDIILAILVSFNIVLSLLENEYFYKETKKYLEKFYENRKEKEITQNVYKFCEKRKITKMENILRYINLGDIFIILIFNYLHYHFKLNFKKFSKKVSATDTLLSTGDYKFFLFECFILIICDPPGLNYFFTGTMENFIFAFSLGSLICIISFFKSYIIIRVYAYFSRWMTDTAYSLANDAHVNGGLHFAFKSELKKRPYSILLFVLVISICMFGFSLRAFEYFAIEKGFQYGSFSGAGNDQDYLKDLQNSIWLIIITMTTVGYGDYTPSENYGRVICIIAYILGNLLVSITIVVLGIISEFSEEEKKAYNLIKRIKTENNLDFKAADVISCLCMLRIQFLKVKDNNDKKNGKKNNKLSERFVNIMKLKKSIINFKDEFKVASNIRLPIEKSLQITTKQLDENYERITANILMLKDMGEIIKGIHESQKICYMKMRNIFKREKVLDEYLVNINNDSIQKSLEHFIGLKSKQNKKNNNNNENKKFDK